MHWPMAAPIAHTRLSLKIFSKEKIADYMRERERERERAKTRMRPKVVAQLTSPSIPLPENPGSNPVIYHFY